MTRAGSDFDVAIVGGGFAGLSAATALAERQKRVVVLEARPGLGGRATAFTDPETGERVDNGQHVVIGGYHETFAFLRRIGCPEAIRLQPQLSVGFVDRTGRRSTLRCPAWPPPLHLAGGLLRWNALTWRDRLAALRILPAVRAFRHAPLDGGTARMTVRRWLEHNGQTPRLIEMLWEPLAVAALNESIDVAAPGPFAHVMGRMFGGRRADAALGLPARPLDEVYAEPARLYIEAHGGQVRTGAPAVIRGAPAMMVTVRDQVIPARAVICAVPWFALDDVIVDAPALQSVLAAASATPASAIVTVNVWLDRAVMDQPFIGLPGRTFQWVFDRRALLGNDSSHLSMIASDANAIVGHPNDAIIDLALAELRTAISAAQLAKVRRALAVREKRATFSVAPGLPARPPTETPVPGLFLAGDWIDTGLPATIESAVVSGQAAAQAALHYLDRPVNS